MHRLRQPHYMRQWRLAKNGLARPLAVVLVLAVGTTALAMTVSLLGDSQGKAAFHSAADAVARAKERSGEGRFSPSGAQARVLSSVPHRAILPAVAEAAGATPAARPGADPLGDGELERQLDQLKAGPFGVELEPVVRRPGGDRDALSFEASVRVDSEAPPLQVEIMGLDHALPARTQREVREP